MKFRLEFEANWSPQKVRQVQNQILQDLRSYLGVSNASEIVAVGETEEEKKITRLSLYCNNREFGRICAARWTAEVFTPCPKCGSRRYVHKELPEEKAS